MLVSILVAPPPVVITLVNVPLLAVTLPESDTIWPVKLAVLTIVVNLPLAPVTLPVTDTNPPVTLGTLTIVVNMPLLAVTLPERLSDAALKLPLFKFPTVISPVTLRLPPLILPLTDNV